MFINYEKFINKNLRFEKTKSDLKLFKDSFLTQIVANLCNAILKVFYNKYNSKLYKKM